MVFEKVQEIIHDKFNIDMSSITLQSDIREDLDADSLDLIDMITEIEDYFELHIPTEVLTEITTVNDLVNYIESQM